ncbi:MAG: hypothetical protein OEU51_02275 [Gammaproteobacteria bacterium]|nr:hypothetical protein [Gammaproteobacteria bacterium]
MIYRLVACFLLPALLSILVAGLVQAESSQGALTGGITLTYEEQEAGVEAYPVRILVVPEYLRMDDGHDDDDFMLFDRDSRTIFSINHEDRGILVIEQSAPGGGRATLPDLNLGIEKAEDKNIPLIAGKRPEIYRFTADGDVCLEAVVAPGLLQPAVQALGEYGRLLAERQRATLDSTPVEFRTPCYLSRYVYAPDRPLEKGLPIQEWDNSGYRRTLTDFRDYVQIDPKLFELPSAYNRNTLGR